MVTATPVMPVPFGMTLLVEAPARAAIGPARYDESLQIGVGADGNPWHSLADGDTKTETTPDGSGSGTDGDGTDVW